MISQDTPRLRRIVITRPCKLAPFEKNLPGETVGATDDQAKNLLRLGVARLHPEEDPKMQKPGTGDPLDPIQAAEERGARQAQRRKLRRSKTSGNLSSLEQRLAALEAEDRTAKERIEELEGTLAKLRSKKAKTVQGLDREASEQTVIEK